MIRTLLK